MAGHPLIQTVEEVEALAAALRDQTAIAIDTEADSFFHYMDKLCLVQIGYGEGFALIDPLALPPAGLAPLEGILSSPRIRKVFHAADYDLYSSSPRTSSARTGRAGRCGPPSSSTPRRTCAT
jgi:ribonuclease D